MQEEVNDATIGMLHGRQSLHKLPLAAGLQD